MDIAGCVALVTGANRGLGKAFVEALLAAGAAKIYSGMRDPAPGADGRVVPVRLDVTSGADIAAAASACPDVSLLVNNAGILLPGAALDEGMDDLLRRTMEVNVIGLVNVTRAFAPALARNGGGAVVNLLSVVSWFTNPFTAAYCASKYAALAMSDGMRIQLAGQGTQVVAVHPGFVDTDMTANVTQPKVSPRQVAERTLDAVRGGRILVLPDDRAEQVWHDTHAAPGETEARMQQQWDAARRG